MSGQRSRKDLACTADATAHQRQFVADLRRRVIDNGEPFAIAQADTPHEIFHAMDIPLMTRLPPLNRVQTIRRLLISPVVGR